MRPVIIVHGGAGRVRNPIRLARRILEDGRHILLVGEGAIRFARETRMEECEDAELIVDRQRQRWQGSDMGGPVPS